MPTMRAARLHEPGKPFRIDEIEIPAPRPGDVLVKVKACGIVPNMNAIISGKFWHHLPPMPAVIGLDAAGTVARVPNGRSDIGEGDRVYVNPFLNCGQCHYCRSGTPLLCSDAALRGYFGFTPRGAKLLEDYPIGGLSEYLTAAPHHLVKLPQQVTFEQGARFGYLGTSFAALRRGGAGAGSWIAIHGITGTLGVNAVLLAMAMGITRILGWARNREVLARLRTLAPERVDTLALGERPLKDWVRERTDGVGVDVLIDCTGRGGPAAPVAQAVDCLKRGGVMVNIGALAEPLALNPTQFMTGALQYRGSNWFTNAEAALMADMVRTGALDLSPLEPRVYPLEQVNQALADIRERPGGFQNFVVAVEP
jgi:D-arabinose 1-dehydrogenase-like Zn-dependent alcohol dehydrogenase